MLDTLMTVWLAWGGVSIEMNAPAEMCWLAMRALETNGVVIVELGNGMPVPAVKVACQCVAQGDAL